MYIYIYYEQAVDFAHSAPLFGACNRQPDAGGAPHFFIAPHALTVAPLV